MSATISALAHFSDNLERTSRARGRLRRSARLGRRVIFGVAISHED